MPSAWEVTSHDLTPAGHRYTVVLGQREWIVLHAASGWQFYDGVARCEPNGGVREAVLRYERENDVKPVSNARRFTTTRQDVEDFCIRTGFYEAGGY